MGLVNFSNIQDGTTIDANDVNGPFNTIYDEFNGNITNANIASAAAIAGSKLADTSVTVEKLTLGLGSAFNASTGTMSSSTFTATLTGGGTSPSVTVTVPTSGKVLVIWGANMAHSVSGNRVSTSVVLSGANTLAASSADADINAMQSRFPNTNGGYNSRTVVFTGLNAGSTTFQMQYAVQTAGTGTWDSRQLIVIPLPQ